MPKASSRPPAGGAPALARVLDRRVEDLRGLVRRALSSWDADAIHQARVATRRLKAATDLLQPLLPDEPRRRFGKALRKLRRTLGPLRDADVMLVHLGEMKVPPSCAAGAAWVTRRLEERRAELRRHSSRKLTPRQAASRLAAWVDLEQEVRDAQGTAGTLLARVAPGQVRDFASRADRLVRAAGVTKAAGESPGAVGASAGAAGAAAAVADASSDDVHELRVAGKLLRYTLELAEPLGRDVPGSVAKEFKRLQEALGLWHDYVVLTNEMLRLAIDAELAARDPDVFGEVLDLARCCWGKSTRHLGQFRTLWAERGAALAERVVDVFAAAEGPSPGGNGGGAARTRRPADLPADGAAAR